MILSITILSIVLIVIRIVYKLLSEKKKYHEPIYLQNLRAVCTFLDLIRSLDDYVTWIQRNQIKSKYASAGQFFRNKTSYYKKEVTVKNFNEIFEDFDNYTIRYNQDYVNTQNKRLQAYFDNIEGKRLDEQQRIAVITDEYSNLIIAGAGSGKTLTILAKVQYLIEQKGIYPDDILLLSFTKKTVEELNERLIRIGIGTRATTFHKLGYDTIKN